MKKSKIIIPAAAILALSVGASVTGTVAWFTASRSVTLTGKNVAAINAAGDLKVKLTAGNGTTVKDNAVNLSYLRDVSMDVSGKDVIVIDDIIDTGHTLKYITKYFMDKGASSVKTCCLLDKPEGRKVDINADYVGHIIPNEFVVGYGLDYDGLYRNLDIVGVLKPEVYSK